VHARGGVCTGPTSLRASSSKTAISSLRSMSSPTSPNRRTIAARPPAQTGTGVCMRARLHVRVAHGQGRGAGSTPRGSRKSSHRESGRGTWRWSWRPRAPSLDMHARARTHTHAHAHDTRLATRDTRHATRHHVRRGFGASAAAAARAAGRGRGSHRQRCRTIPRATRRPAAARTRGARAPPARRARWRPPPCRSLRFPTNFKGVGILQIPRTSNFKGVQGLFFFSSRERALSRSRQVSRRAAGVVGEKGAGGGGRARAAG